jgi:ABC-type multidrug transport system ATPase subunit
MGDRVIGSVLTADGLVADRGSRRILSGVSFTLMQGEILGVIGPNGAGKTTLFECVAGLQPWTSGSVSGERRFYMPDGIRPWPDQTVEWTLRFAAAMNGTSMRWESPLALEHLARQRVSSLSKGEVKRLNIAAALLSNEPIVLLDEPFDGLDVRQTRNVIPLLRASSRTLMLSIHQLGDAARICDRVLLLNEGRVVAEGSPAELGDLEELFLAHT